jgi:hypothetical protein
MEITLYLAQYAELLDLPFGQVIYRLFFWYFGWMPFAFVFLWLARELWLDWRSSLWSAKQSYLLLAIDVPNNNAQSPKSVENFFSYLHAAQSGPNLMEKWWEGKYQQSFSFEIVSIEGYIQFLIRVPSGFKDFVMTGLYAQYPDAEISVVNDYVDAAPDRYPDLDKDLWGSDFLLTGPQAMPIKVYKEFEHMLGAPEMTYRDTMASLMDVMSSLGPGEQLWYQIIATPTGFDWLKDSAATIDKLAGIKKKASPFSKTLFGKILVGVGKLAESLNPWNVTIKKAPEKDKEVSWMNMHPKTKRQIDAIQMKATKIGYSIKIRAIYLADKNVMNRAKGVSGFVGYMKQFAALDLNGFMPDGKSTATSTAYFRAAPRVNKRKNRIISSYKNRSSSVGKAPYVLNVEELATIWHFPIDAVVKAPLLQRASSRKVEAPMSLPFGSSNSGSSSDLEPIFDPNYHLPESSIPAQPASASALAVSDAKAPLPAKSNSDFIKFLEQENSDKGAAPANLPFV